jgi:hypothetical protein
MKFGKKHIQMVDYKGDDVPRRNYRYARPALKAAVDLVVMEKKPVTLYDKERGLTLARVWRQAGTTEVVIGIDSPRRLANLMLEVQRKGRK